MSAMSSFIIATKSFHDRVPKKVLAMNVYFKTKTNGNQKVWKFNNLSGN